MSDDIEVPDADEDGIEQLQADDTLIDRGVTDVLDEGYIAPDNWSVAQGFGNTRAETRQGETLDQRVAQELPEEKGQDDSPWNPDGESREVGSKRAGRLVSVLDRDGESLALAVGIDGGAASAEEAAVYVIEDDDDDEE